MKMRAKLIQRLDQPDPDTTLPDSPKVIFDQFSRRVLPELKQINLLFDEYTPHDDTHMSSLLRIADKLLGDEMIERLNGCEACVLACAIYGHDWGMAVSPDEKEHIVTGARVGKDFALLPDEQERWREYARSEGIGSPPDGHVDDPAVVTKDQWRGYVRRTHADRARVRAIDYFRSMNDLEQLGTPVGDVCAGHWYDIARIRSMETDWTAGGQRLNLRALAIYMRFIDLLDIGSNRTPFALWKFINPRNVVSATEWKKHRALNPINIDEECDEKYGRTLRVCGETDDHNVYAALQDLQRYIEQQISENVSTLRGLKHYDIGSITLEWQVKALRFEPIDIRFEFDRESMFDLVSGEIYDGDPYVFIRELLQNAIDATELRRRRYRQDGASLHDLAIHISVEHQNNGDAKITVTDAGTGMDVDIVRDYLATVGRSYYRSREFRDLKTGMNAISRFGVGLLSCFEVADHMSLVTRTDPKFGPSEALRVQIADRSQQFRVQKIAAAPVGTSVTAWAKASKWRKGEFSECPRLQVTDYVKAIAGFVGFPIHVAENGTKTVLCSPLIPATELQAIKAMFPLATVFQSSSVYSLEEALVPQDREIGNRILEAHTLKIFRHLDGTDITGYIGHCIPTGNVLSSVRSAPGPGRGATYTIKNQGSIGKVPLRWAHDENSKAADNLAPSTRHSPLRRIHLRGILIPEVKLDIPSPGGAPPLRVALNIEGGVDDVVPLLSRRGIRSSTNPVREAIIDELVSDVRRRYLDEFEKSEPIDRVVLLARLARYLAPPTILLRCFPTDKLPVLILDGRGQVSVVQLDVLPQEIEIVPKYLLQQQADKNDAWAATSIVSKIVRGAGQIVRDDRTMAMINFGFEYDDGSAMEWNDMDQYFSVMLKQQYRRKGARFVISDRGPYIIEGWETGITPPPSVDKGKLDTHNVEFIPLDVENVNIMCLLRLKSDQVLRNYIDMLTFNSRHPASSLLERAINATNDRLTALPPLVAGHIRDTFHALPFVGQIQVYRPGFFEPIVPRWVSQFCLAAADAGIITLTEAERRCLRACFNSVVVRCYE